jgi:hypothetical protein
MEFPHQYRTTFLRFLSLSRLLIGLAVVVPLTGEPVDFVAARVDDQVIALSDLRWFIQYRRIPLPEIYEQREALFSEILEQLINQRLITRETAKTPFIKVTEAELREFARAYEQQFSSSEAYASALRDIGMREEDLHELLRRQLAVNKFVELRFEPFIIILPDDIQDFYSNEYLPELAESGQPAPPLSVVAETIRDILTVRRTGDELERWVQNARQNARILILLGKDTSERPNLPDQFLEQIQFRELRVQ